MTEIVKKQPESDAAMNPIKNEKARQQGIYGAIEVYAARSHARDRFTIEAERHFYHKPYGDMYEEINRSDTPGNEVEKPKFVYGGNTDSYYSEAVLAE